ncbi:unnamed protein product [Prunus armeniaca]
MRDEEQVVTCAFNFLVEQGDAVPSVGDYPCSWQRNRCNVRTIFIAPSASALHKALGFGESYKLAAKAIARLQSLPSGSMERLCGTMVQEVFELTGYDRVMMAYKFHDDDDDHGEVVYEITKPGLESHIWVCIYEEARGSGGNSFLRTPICGSISAIKVISMAGEKKRAYNRNG